MTSTTTPIGKGKTSMSRTTRANTSQRGGPTEKITSPGRRPVLSQEPAAATETSGSKYPVGMAPLAKQEEVEPIYITSGEEEVTTPESAAADTELTQVLGTLTLKKEQTTEGATIDVIQASPSLATLPANVAEDPHPQLEMECDDSPTQVAALTAPAVLIVAPQVLGSPPTSCAQSPAANHPSEDEEVIDEDALLGDEDGAADDPAEYELKDEVDVSEEEEDSTPDS